MNMEEEEAIRRVTIAFGITCDEIKRTLDGALDIQRRKQMFDAAQRQVRIISKGGSKSYLSPYAKFDKRRKKALKQNR